MKLNTKIRYGLRTMIEIAMNSGHTGIFQKDIAERQDIPIKYLDKIIAGLKAAGLILNTGGKKSGYILARKASEISVYDIYKAFEGKMAIIQCVHETSFCCASDICASQEYWNDLNTRIKSSMAQKTLDELAKRQQELELSRQQIDDYQI